jgi:hypothetical protein
MNEIKALLEAACQVLLEPFATGYMLRCGNALGFTAGQEKDVSQCSGSLLLYQFIGKVDKNVLAVLAATAKILNKAVLVG